MAKSRRAIAWLALCAVIVAPAGAQTLADDAAAAHRERLDAVLRPACPVAARSDEIVVCAPRDEDERHRLRPIEGNPMAAASRAGGEQRAALAAGASSCTPVGRDQRCSGGIDVIGAAFTIVRAVSQLVANQD
jgi:Tfp pilus assembly protein FimT